MLKNKSREKGQVMILMALGFVVFLAFVALAIDGGMIYSERRQAQNASDAGSLAGGGAAALSLENSGIVYANFNCGDGRVVAAEQAAIAAAISRAANNRFVIDADISDVNGVSAVCGIDSSYGYVDKYIDVTVKISETIKTNFAQVFYNGRVRNQVQAVTRVRPRSPIAYGHAVVALNDAPCSGNTNGATFGGSSDVDINGGGVWTNGCLRGNGGAYDVNVTNGSVLYAGQETGSMNFTPDQAYSGGELPSGSYEFPPPNCANAVRTWDNLRLNNGTLDLNVPGPGSGPGLYCVTGDMVINGGVITGTGVTFYLPTGDISISGNATVDLEAPSTDPAPNGAIMGMLFYVANGNIDMEGNDETEMLGVAYAPRGQIKAHGANGTNPTFNTQLIGWNVDVSGNADIDINFDASRQSNIPTAIELWK